MNNYMVKMCKNYTMYSCTYAVSFTMWRVYRSICILVPGRIPALVSGGGVITAHAASVITKS